MKELLAIKCCFRSILSPFHLVRPFLTRFSLFSFSASFSFRAGNPHDKIASIPVAPVINTRESLPYIVFLFLPHKGSYLVQVLKSHRFFTKISIKFDLLSFSITLGRINLSPFSNQALAMNFLGEQTLMLTIHLLLPIIPFRRAAEERDRRAAVLIQVAAFVFVLHVVNFSKSNSVSSLKSGVKGLFFSLHQVHPFWFKLK